MQRHRSGSGIAALVGLTVLMHGSSVLAASSKGCDGGGFTLQLAASSVSGKQKVTIAAARLGNSFLLKGKYVTFEVDAVSFGIRNYTLTGAPNPLDITGGVATVVYAAKTPDHRGLSLSSDLQLELADDNVSLARTGTGLSMKLTAKDCANGGVFQMEPERRDGGTTDITHVLGTGVFYYDNPNFRARAGDVVPYKDTTATVGTRVNFGNDIARLFVGRDSPQVATRILQGCPNTLVKRDGSLEVLDHCGGISLWRVASGGRMGQVMGEDATEVAPPATACTQNCQAQNQVKGRATNLGNPFPVPSASRLGPRTR